MKRRLLLAAAAVPLAGCSTAAKWLGIAPTTPLRRIQVVASPGMNEDNATAVDLVFAYDAAAVSMLPKNAPQWFASKNALRATLGPSLDVVELQMAPEILVPEAPLPQRHRKALAVVSFANYLGPRGQAPGQLTPFRCVAISLGPRDVQYQDCDPK